jgi:two-component system sensor kinase FixL
MQRNIARSTVVRYGVAVASVAVAVVLGLWLRPLALAAAQLLLIAVLITGWVGGLRPALVGWGLATLALGYYFTAPVEEIPRLAIFALVAGFMATMSAARRKAEDALKSARDGLEERVRERTALLREQAGLLDLTHDSVFVRDMADVITYWNRAAEEFYGWTANEAVGQVSHHLMRTVFPAPIEHIRAELLMAGRWEGELVHTKADGRRAVVASRWSLQHDERGQPLAILETNNDLTDHIRAAEALQQAQAELAHVTRLTTLGELTASIAHEVNQPLAAIVGDANASLNWLATPNPDLGSVREALDAIVKDGHRAAEVIQRIRQLATKTGPQKAQVDVNDVIRDVVPLVGTQVRRHEVTLRIDLTPTPLPVLADRVQLQQVLINFVINGLEAMEAVDDRPRELVIRSRPHDVDHVLVAVQDAGVGIDPSARGQLFDAFFTTKPGGMGMGLSISRSIIEAHGGRLWATPNPGHGATFHFALPGVR